MDNQKIKQGRPYKFGVKVETAVVGIRVPFKFKEEAKIELEKIQESFFKKLETDEKE